MKSLIKHSRSMLLAAGTATLLTACNGAQQSESSESGAAIAEANSERAYFANLLDTPFAAEADAASEPVDFAIAFTDLPDGVRIDTGTVSVVPESGATRVENFALVYDLDGTAVGVEADEVLFYDFDPNAIADRLRGTNLTETVKVADRIELNGVKTVGMEAVSKLFLDQYTNAIDEFTPLDDEVVTELNAMDVFSYNLTIEKALMDGFTLHPFVYNKPVPLLANEETEILEEVFEVDNDDAEMREVFQQIGAFARSFSIDDFAYENVTADYAMSIEEAGVQIDMSMDMTVALAGMRGYDRGDIEFSGSWDASLDGTMPIPDESGETTELKAISMTGGVSTSTVSGMRLSRAFEALANWQLPETTEADLFDLGRWEMTNYALDMADKNIFNADRIYFDSDFHWLLPTSIELSLSDTGYNIGNLFQVMTQEMGEELEPGLTMEDVRKGLQIVEQYGFDCICGDYAVDLNWSPETGEITYRENGKFADAFSGKTSVDIDFSTPAKIAGLFDLDDPESGFEAAFKEDFAFHSLEYMITDTGGLSNLFEMLHAIGEAFPEQEGMAMLTYNDAAQLRMLAVNGVISMKPMARQQVPNADPWMDAVATFLEEGGSLTVAVEPPTPITFGLIESLEESDGDVGPERLFEIFGLTVTHTK
ncbi:MAG: hypothetical protein AAFV59_04470 [Pseudomonadota bacterium]